jgi:hypothetical protein
LTITHTPLPTETPACSPNATFGNSNVESSLLSFNGVYCNRAVAASPGTILNLSLYKEDASQDTVRVAVYDDDGASGGPGTLRCQSQNTLVAGLGWVNVDVPDLPVTAGTYWLALQTNVPIARGSGPVSCSYFFNQTEGSFTTPAPGGGNYSNILFSFYANYCAP